ncbi:unnamed protein product [Meloidogyne enterolobii]|uniref:Uncharacterized protein n=1 Tax=Meloidogyne enterolobii TaxID=390850 RepID=A0ACB1ASB9_MELEN
MSKLDDDLVALNKNIENDLVATWTVPMSDKVYKIEFDHGTTTGKRILRVNGKVNIEAVGIFAYEYTLQVGGKTYEKFREQQKKALQVFKYKYS